MIGNSRVDLWQVSSIKVVEWGQMLIVSGISYTKTQFAF